jgi:hypothetical protein
MALVPIKGVKEMDIQAQAMRALDLLESSNVMQEFPDAIWIEVDRDLWEAFIGDEGADA